MVIFSITLVTNMPMQTFQRIVLEKSRHAYALALRSNILTAGTMLLKQFRKKSRG